MFDESRVEELRTLTEEQGLEFDFTHYLGQPAITISNTVKGCKRFRNIYHTDQKSFDRAINFVKSA